MTERQDVERPLNRVVVNLSLARLSDAMGNGFVIIAIPLSVAALPHEFFPFSESFRVGLTVSLFGFVLAVAQPIFGRIASRYTADRLLLVAGTAGFSVATATMGLASSYWHLLLLRTLQGLFIALVVPSTLSLIARYAPPVHRGAAMGFYGMTRMLGFGLGPIIGGAVLLGLTTSQSFSAAAIPGAVAAILVFFGVPRQRARHRDEAQSRRASRPVEAESKTADPGLRPFLALSFGLFTAACSLSSMSVLENDFMRRLDQNTFEFGVAFSALVIIRIFVDWPAGRLSDRVGRKRLIIPGLAFLGPLTVLMAYAPSTLALTGVRVLMGVSMAFVSAPTFALSSDLAPAHSIAAKVAWVTAGFSMGLAVGPLATGGLAHRLGFHTPFWIFGALCLIAAAVMRVIVRERIP